MPRSRSRSVPRRDRTWVTCRFRLATGPSGDVSNAALMVAAPNRSIAAGADAVVPAFNFLTPDCHALRPFTVSAIHMVGLYVQTRNVSLPVGYAGVGVQGMSGSAVVADLPDLGEADAAKSFPLVLPFFPRAAKSDSSSGDVYSVVEGGSKGMRKVQVGQAIYVSEIGLLSSDELVGYVRFLAIL